MSTFSDLLGEPIRFDHEGKTYTASLITQQVKAKIERWLRAAAYADLYALRDIMPPDQYQDALASLGRDRAAYAYLGPVYWQTVGTDEGSVMMVSILFGCSEGEARNLCAARSADVSAIVQEIVLSSMPPVQAAIARARLTSKQGKQDLPLGADPTLPAGA